MFRIERPSTSVSAAAPMQQCYCLCMRTRWQKVFGELQISFHGFLRLPCRSFSDSLSFLSLSLPPDGLYMSEMSAWLVTDWPWSPKRTEAIFKPRPPNHCARQARLPGQHTLGVWASVGPALALVCPRYTDAVTLWICQGSSCSIKYCIGLRGCVQGLAIL